MGLAVMMGVQTPAMAAETSQEFTTQETMQESAAQEMTQEVKEQETATSQELATQETTPETPVEEVYEPVVQAEQETEAEVVVQAAEADGWHQNDDGSRYYVKDGEVLTGCIEKIGDSYYGFDWDGVMYVDTDFWLFDEEAETDKWYRAKADGSLYVNEWYSLDEWYTYYYGADGKRYSGLQTIDGKQYYFNENDDTLYQDTMITAEDGTIYFCDEEGVATELVNNDWTEIAGKKYYIKDGQVLKDCVEKIGDFYYGFDWDGVMYADSEFGIWNAEIQKYENYRAKADGRLYVNEWYIYNEWNTYYYGADGKAYRGVQTIDGNQYYFEDNGTLRQDDIVTTEDGRVYFCDENGIATELINNDWTEIAGKKYYVKDGQVLKGCIEKIGDFYYGFDWNGVMYADMEFSIWNEETRESHYYRAKANGSLYVNEWYDGGNEKYYYGADAEAYSGLQTIEGKQYYFDEYGSLYQDTIIKAEDGSKYYCDIDGIATKLPETGWAEMGGKYYYIKDGEFLKNCVEKIGDSYYGFDYNGVMYSDTEIFIWNNETQKQEAYRAKANGRLYANEWYKDGETKYYYGADARRCSGLQIIEGKQYYFSEGDWLYTNTIVAAKDGTYYYCDAEGIATELPKAGWVEMGGQRYYVKDGKVLKNCVEKIDDVYYAFDYNGKLRSEGFFNIWNAEREEDDFYRAKSDGTLYVNEWYIPEESYLAPRYYGEDAKAYKGLHTIDRKAYYFNEFYGELCRKRIITAEDGTHYYCDADGIAIKLENNGWMEIDGNKRYVKNGDFLKLCVEKIDGFYYAFDYDGNMRTNESFYVWSNESDREFYYRAKGNGTLYENEWYFPEEDSYETPYYYGEEAKAYSGLKEVDGVLYYFGENGQRYQGQVAIVDGKSYYCNEDGKAVEISEGWNQVDGKHFYVKDGYVLSGCVAKIGDLYYGFDNTGAMYSNEEFGLWDYELERVVFYRARKDGSLYVNEWYENQYDRFYYGEGGKAAYGFQIIDGKKYYFWEGGSIRVNVAFTVDGKNYYCYEDGSIIELDKDGWNKVGEEYLYVEDGELLTDCIALIDGSYYGFAEDGVLYRDMIFSRWNMASSEHDYYWASSSGALYTNAWANDWYTMYYYGADGKRYKGIQTIDGIQYGFDEEGQLVLSGAITSDDRNYYCDAEGRITELPNNQWYKGDNGGWYYVQDGTLLKNCTAQIGEAWYQFDSWGKMQTQGLNANADGSLRVNTWFYDGTYWHYYGEEGQMYQYGLYEIAGTNYYFANGNMVTSTVVSANGKLYVADANGCLTPIPKNGWVLAGSDYYYAEEGRLITNKIRKINGVYYAFDNNGKMYADGEYVCNRITCRARANGSLYVSQWYQDVKGNWYYYGQDANRVSGEAEVNGIKYLFNSSGTLKANGVVQKDGKYYLADENGILVQTPGWILNGGSWYYVQSDGSLYQGILKDGGYTYYMNPRMVTDSELKVVDGIVYNIDASGHAVVAPDGFYHNGILNDLYYIADGKSAEKGWKEINGNLYYFGKSDTVDLYWAVADGIYGIDNQYYLFNPDGTLASAGWHLDSNGKWYYAYASGVVATGDTLVNGTLYHFSDDGELKTGVIVEDGKCNLYSDDGTLLETGSAQGWNLLGGNYYYLRDNSLLKSGEYKLPDGNWYAFDSQGRMWVNTRESNRWYGESGAARTGWFMVGRDWYYASAIEGMLYRGLHVINGAEYYFDAVGTMLTGQIVVGTNLLTTDSSGAVIATSPMQDGWSCYGDEWYYYQNGKPYTGWVGAYYIDDGHMVRNSMVILKDKKYYLGEDGAYVTNTWCEGYLNSAYYAKADGTFAQSEWLEIAGKLYCFDKSGYVVSCINDYMPTENGVYGVDGAYLSADGYPQGWSLIDGTYYYKEGEKFVINQAKKINGDWYLFDVHGRMVTGFSTSDFDIRGWKNYYYDDGNFYYGADGRRCSYVGWQVIDGNWYYFDAASKAVSGWQIINGVKYYFNTEYGTNKHAMVIGYCAIDKKLYYFDANGVCQGVCGPQTGWYQAGEDWYYMRGGCVVTGSNTIDGNQYYFDSNGVWVPEW